ncbi:MAG: hypothetical protein NVS9B10_03510 [Nevskia sp.]
MAFKGGRSLSKVFDAINRFSEDVDVALDHRGFGSDIAPFDAKTSRSRIKKLSDSPKGFVREHTHGVAAPRFTGQLRAQFESERAHRDRRQMMRVLEEQVPIGRSKRPAGRVVAPACRAHAQASVALRTRA